MARWLAISNRENAAIAIQREIWGVSKRYANIIGKVKVGDTLLLYVGHEMGDKGVLPPEIVATFKVSSGVSEDDSKIFKGTKNQPDEIYPYRIKLRPMKVYKQPLDFKSVVPEMEFIRKKNVWGCYLRTAMREISEHDYEKIVKRAR